MADLQDAFAEEEQSTPEAEMNLEDSYWEVVAASDVVEYFHTGNLVDVLSPYPWATAVKEKNHEIGINRGGGSGNTNPLLTSPPEDLAVSLYLESEPANTLVEVTVPRWLSDGEVWEVSPIKHSCSDS